MNISESEALHMIFTSFWKILKELFQSQAASGMGEVT
jgi:hypothetical protein